MNRKMTLLAVVVAAIMLLSACGTNADVSSDSVPETQPPASTPAPQSPSSEQKQAGNINDNFSYEYYYTPYDSTNETYLDERYWTVIATNNNDIEVKGDFKVYLTSNGVMPDTSVPGGRVSQEYVLAPGGTVMFSSFTSNGNSLDYEFDEIVVIPNMESRTEEEIKDEPLSIMNDITFEYTIENNIIKGKLTNHNETYTTSNIFLDVALFNGKEYKSFSMIWYMSQEIGDASLCLAPGESLEFTMDRTDHPAFDNLKYTINASGWLNDYE